MGGKFQPHQGLQILFCLVQKQLEFCPWFWETSEIDDREIGAHLKDCSKEGKDIEYYSNGEQTAEDVRASSLREQKSWHVIPGL